MPVEIVVKKSWAFRKEGFQDVRVCVGSHGLGGYLIKWFVGKS